MFAIADIADDYIHISATLNSICAEDTTPNKKWDSYISLFDFRSKTFLQVEDY